MASPSDRHEDGLIGNPSLRAPPSRTASNRDPVAWLTTTDPRGPSASTAHRLVAYHGTPLAALVDPSTGSRTTTTGRSRRRGPDSSDMTPTPARSSTERAASSATRSDRYCPDRVPAGPQSERLRSPSAMAVAAACSTSSSSSSPTLVDVTGGHGDR